MQTISMGLFNVCSLSNKTFIISDLILDYNIDCLFLTETWLGTDAQIVPTEASLHNLIFYLLLERVRKVVGLHPLSGTSLDQMQCYCKNLVPLSPTPLFLAVLLYFVL